MTTPESLDSLISHMPEMVKDVRAVVLDELHMVDGTYRGDQLRVLLRRVAALAPGPISVYAASATVSDPKGLAMRYMSSPSIVSSPGGRGIDYRIVPSLEQATRIFRERGLKKCLIFCNTPEEVETLANGDMRKWFPPQVIKVHHGKLQVPKRVEAERALRSDDRVVCACTSTLEVGVDIGDIDMVILASRPRSVASIAQRIGRANRREKRISTIAVARSSSEAAYYDKVFEAIVRSRYSSEEHSFDPSVVVQQIFSTLAGPTAKGAGEVQALFRGILPDEELASVWGHLHDGGWIEQIDDGAWTLGKRARAMGPKIYSNIPGAESIEVVEVETGQPIGDIALPIDNIFILGGAGLAGAQAAGQPGHGVQGGQRDGHRQLRLLRPLRRVLRPAADRPSDAAQEGDGQCLIRSSPTSPFPSRLARHCPGFSIIWARAKEHLRQSPPPVRGS